MRIHDEEQESLTFPFSKGLAKLKNYEALKLDKQINLMLDDVINQVSKKCFRLSLYKKTQATKMVSVSTCSTGWLETVSLNLNLLLL